MLTPVPAAIQETANTLVCFLIEYMQPDFDSEDSRGPLPAYSEQLIEQLEEGSHNKRVRAKPHSQPICGYTGF